MAKEKVVFTGEQVENILISLNEMGWYDLFFGQKENIFDEQELYTYNQMKDKKSQDWTIEETALNMKLIKKIQEDEAVLRKELLCNTVKTKKLASLLTNTDIEDIRIAEREVVAKMPIFQAEFI